jgi:hypothetical protein
VTTNRSRRAIALLLALVDRTLDNELGIPEALAIWEFFAAAFLLRPIFLFSRLGCSSWRAR